MAVAASARDAGRRLLDVVGALLLLALALPLLLGAALGLLVTSGRPILFRQWRLGKDGRPYQCLKLRTMVVDAEQRLADDPHLHHAYVGNGFKLPNGSDPRITRFGSFLRRRYIDELPQLFNVLGGSMSLLGPRPIVPDELSAFGPDAQVLLTHKPGLFGDWTSRGRARPPYPERARIEIDYVRNRSLRRDMLILARSARALLDGQGEL